MRHSHAMLLHGSHALLPMAGPAFMGPEMDPHTSEPVEKPQSYLQFGNKTSDLQWRNMKQFATALYKGGLVALKRVDKKRVELSKEERKELAVVSRNKGSDQYRCLQLYLMNF